MADNGSSELIVFAYAVFIQSIIGYSLVALVAYDYVITFGQEVKFFWRRPISIATIVFFMNRYLVIAYSATSPLSTAWVAAIALSCVFAVRFTEVVDILQQVVFALFSALRVHALSQRNWSMTTLIMCLLLVPVATAIYFFAGITIQHLGPPFNNCFIVSGISEAGTKRVTYATRIPVIVADALVVVLTWIKTFHHVRTASAVGVRVSLSTILLRDGTWYFLALLTMNIAQMILANTTSDYIDPFLNMLTPILVSRFLLDLRQEGQSDMDSVHLSNTDVNFRIPSNLSESDMPPNPDSSGSDGRDILYGASSVSREVEEIQLESIECAR